MKTEVVIKNKIFTIFLLRYIFSTFSSAYTVSVGQRDRLPLFVVLEKVSRKKKYKGRKGSRWKSAREKEKVRGSKLNLRNSGIPDVKEQPFVPLFHLNFFPLCFIFLHFLFFRLCFFACCFYFEPLFFLYF
jgi:hypothetical protein